MKRKLSLVIRKTAAIFFAFAAVVGTFTLKSFAANSAWLTLDTFTGMPGKTIMVSGGGYTPNAPISLFARIGNTEPDPNEVSYSTTDAEGKVGPVKVHIPLNAPEGPLAIQGITNFEAATNSYYVTPFTPTVKAVYTTNSPYSMIRVEGAGFAPNEKVKVSLESSSGVLLADSKGAFTDAWIMVPNVPAATYNVVGKGLSSNASAIDYFYISGFYPSCSPSPYYLLPGEALSFNGSGYAVNETIDLFEGENPKALLAFSANGIGSFSNAGTIIIPKEFMGAGHTFRLKGEKSYAECSTYVDIGKYTPNASPTSYFLTPGQVLKFNGTGYAPNETVSVFINKDGLPTTTFKAKADGSFKADGAIWIPYSRQGAEMVFHLIGDKSMQAVDIPLSVGKFDTHITPSDYFLQHGGTFTVSGDGYLAGEKIFVKINDKIVATTNANSEGAFTSPSIVIPFDAGAAMIVQGVGETSLAVSELSLPVGDFQPNITASKFFVLPGSTVSFSGGPFAPNEDVQLKLGFKEVALLKTDASGMLKANTYTMPYGLPASQDFNLTGSVSHVNGKLTLNVGQYNPVVGATSYYVLAGTKIIFTGGGYAPFEDVQFKVGLTPVGTIHTDAMGNLIENTYYIPFDYVGNHEYNFTGVKTHANASISIYVAGYMPSVTASSYFVQPGNTISFSGNGYAANEDVEFKLGLTQVATFHADSKGALLPNSYTIPFGLSGSQEFNLTGHSSHTNASLTITIAPFNTNATADNYYALPGTKVNVTGTGFSPNEKVKITAGTFSVEADTDKKGNTPTVPVTIPYGTKESITILLTGMTSKATASIQISVAPFTPNVTASTYYGTPGTPVTFKGTGYVAGEIISIKLGNTVLAEATADGYGKFASQAITLPFGTVPAHFEFYGNLSATTFSLDISLASFNAAISLDKYYAIGGTPIKITASGFASNELVKIMFGDSDFGTKQASASGSVSLNTNVPYAAAGQKTVTATGVSSGASASTTFTQPAIYVSVELNTYAGAPGTQVQVIGSGFLPGEVVQIRTDKTGPDALVEFTADNLGKVNNSSWKIPANIAEGNLTIKVHGTHSFTDTDIIFYVNHP